MKRFRQHVLGSFLEKLAASNMNTRVYVDGRIFAELHNSLAQNILKALKPMFEPHACAIEQLAQATMVHSDSAVPQAVQIDAGESHSDICVKNVNLQLLVSH